MERRGRSANFGLMAPILVTFGLGIFISHLLLSIFTSDAMSIKNGLAFSAIRLTQDLSDLRPSAHLFHRRHRDAHRPYAVPEPHAHRPRHPRRRGRRPRICRPHGHPHRSHLRGGARHLAGDLGPCGFMIGMTRTFQPFDGPQFILIAFGVVIIGGLNSLPGSLIGGILLGVTQVLAGTYSARRRSSSAATCWSSAFSPSSARGCFPDDRPHARRPVRTRASAGGCWWRCWRSSW